MQTITVETKEYPVSRFASVVVVITTKNGKKSRTFHARNAVTNLPFGWNVDDAERLGEDYWGTEYPTYEAAKIAAGGASTHYANIERCFR